MLFELSGRVQDWISGNDNYKMGVARIRRSGEWLYKHGFDRFSFARRDPAWTEARDRYRLRRSTIFVHPSPTLPNSCIGDVIVHSSPPHGLLVRPEIDGAFGLTVKWAFVKRLPGQWSCGF